jgi:protein ImuB
MVVWCPDWPVVATAGYEGVDTAEPIAVIDKGLVYACSAAARSEGVKRGLRLREAQARCPQLLVFPRDPVRIDRAFEPVILALEEMSPGVQVVNAGSCALRARGPSRYYGSEEAAAAVLLERLVEVGVTDARIGVSDSLFAASQAARLRGAESVRVVPTEQTAPFLARLPIHLIEEPEFVLLLWRLGIRTLGDFAALQPEDVRVRFGEDGVRAHRRAAGLDGSRVAPRIPPEVREIAVDFEPPLDRIDQITFGIRASGDEFIQSLSEARLVCTALRVELTTETGHRGERTWLHPRWFTPSDVVDRVRWQLQGGSTIESALAAPVARVRIVAETVDDSGSHEPGLWGTSSDERIHHGLSRVQSMVGHEGVLTATVGGGRSPAERQVLVPWGDRIPEKQAAAKQAAANGVKRSARRSAAVRAPVAEQPIPWPGSLPPPLPTTVFEKPRLVLVRGVDGGEIELSDRGELSETPALFSVTAAEADLRPLEAWAGPWPVRERWWDPAAARSFDRFQVVDADGTAWLLMLEGGHWWAEARYD